MNDSQVGFIGLGLIGGSVAKAIKAKYPNTKITAYDPNTKSIHFARQEGVVDTIAASIDDAFSCCDFIFLCAPVSYNITYLTSLKAVIKPECILTDVGSVKTSIHEKVIELELEENFIGGHPMAGSEKTGYENSVSHLIENAYYVLTPSSKISEDKIMHYIDYVETLGSIPIVLDYKEHDYVTAAISHLPHIIASSLVNFVEKKDSSEKIMKNMAAGGFKDITRIASSSPTMWQQICLTNKENISLLLNDYIEELSHFKDLIDSACENDLYHIFDDAREYRNSIANSSLGPIKKIYELYCDIIDEAGGIATIATILASNNISIKNIGIIHNREFVEGALRIEFYDEDSSKRAFALLVKYSYHIYER
ncbi:prephenate dehydrogenase [Lachnotalea glycerini]|uniref:Prephenate dehydrogenase n=1 Tax=Lachnotalea glycerini TaxID=1763509 RepID=A0A255I4K2_9FIRM|nr:prephenate dehydrogenase [Lachnotalea glycerini]PXV95393.1 prephenate dehydrogenase [Lachnotalea glycerini]RDY32716.1 prephenate dehydrogenase/arogenate dehydrogenase family protein [Lachnotalea glycerini]